LKLDLTVIFIFCFIMQEGWRRYLQMHSHNKK
jgi:hypothetical protein